MRDKGIFFDFTPTSYGGLFLKIVELTFVMLSGRDLCVSSR